MLSLRFKYVFIIAVSKTELIFDKMWEVSHGPVIDTPKTECAIYGHHERTGYGADGFIVG